MSESMAEKKSEATGPESLETVIPPPSDEGERPSSGHLPAERPTVVPPFDVESFARASVTATGAPPPSSDPTGAFTEEATTAVPYRWRPEGAAGPFSPSTEMDPRRSLPTLSNEVELERARLRSLAAPSSPPVPPSRPADPPFPGKAPYPRTSSSRHNALSLADARIPTPPEVFAQTMPPPSPVPTDVLPETPTAGSLPPEDDDSPILEVRDSSIPQALQDPAVEMKDRFQLGDYSGAMTLAEHVLLRDPANTEALRLAEECQRILVNMYAAKIGPLDRIPMLMVQPQELRWLSIDHRAGFLLSLVDGVSTLEMILDVGGMPLLDTLRILHDLHQQRIISFRGA